MLAVLKPLWTAKPETASRLRGRIEAVLDAAKAQGHCSGENPAKWRGHLAHLLPKRQKLTRDHHAAMAYVDVPVLMARLRADNAIAAQAFAFCILTATRTGEVLGALWSEIDIAAKVWTVSAARMKTARDTACRCQTGRWPFWRHFRHCAPADLYFRARAMRVRFLTSQWLRCCRGLVLRA